MTGSKPVDHGPGVPGPTTLAVLGVGMAVAAIAAAAAWAAVARGAWSELNGLPGVGRIVEGAATGGDVSVEAVRSLIAAPPADLAVTAAGALAVLAVVCTLVVVGVLAEGAAGDVD